ncbi:putative rust resistance kinase Lr10 [Oryza sativa Japonica Group]|uniref:Os01g0116000 protein n=4 Tax=Oryza sativa TaxID=4530 RepID=A0A0P0UXB8_ORYSJ|nr:receptor-like protein kinase [Oryza sativa Japonica Group]BAB17131.1 putative rust resistance kinase Lr10 [Oryza sativa Japonica Group]BAB17323.1 putative rust resistance kinase Lr10 [Oryza sativa Japonica Group]BAS70080.1 Os01g0116000 [Oryza sativa Japonica Group]
MVIPGPFFRRSTALQVFSVLCVLRFVVPDPDIEWPLIHGIPACPPFTCGHLSKVASPFHRRGYECGVASYELTCTDDKATIQIDNGTYFVTGIDYSDSTFWVVDANISDSRNNCPLPRWKRIPYYYDDVSSDDEESSPYNIQVELDPASRWWSFFVNCSKEINNNVMYSPVACMGTSSSFVYVLTGRLSCYIENLEPSCGYLAMTPLDGMGRVAPAVDSLSYEDVVKFMRKGFRVQFPFRHHRNRSFKDCLMESIPKSTGIGKLSDWFSLSVTENFMDCATAKIPSPYNILLGIILYALMFWTMLAPPCRYLLAPLVVLIFLAQKYLKRMITIDAVEKFLRMQQMLGPTRYAYTDIIAITGHFREKLGQGGYGSVYKGVLLPGDLHVAIKILNGYSNCNGEEFISEVATIGRIHHVNVVRLVGFCSEEMRRALVYEYMPRGSLDKHIFSSERRFSWDKLNEIALGIARGINYLHQGCDMQILHFDIKPHNILLDDNFVPKVADFGLAKLYPRDKSFVSDRALRGTVGYMAPEMVSRSFGIISGKSDVYSFGMLLLEMVGGRRNADPNADSSASKAYYPSWVYDKLIADQQVDEISNFANMHELERKLCLVGLWCIQMKSHDRPTMSEAIEMLEGGVDALQVPLRPFFCDGDGMPPPQVMDSYFHSSDLSAISEEDDGIAELASS